jgi:hypothetical protein
MRFPPPWSTARPQFPRCLSFSEWELLRWQSKLPEVVGGAGIVVRQPTRRLWQQASNAPSQSAGGS